MARGDTPVSPWIWAAEDYVQKVIRITVNYNNATRAIQSAVIHRDDGCKYTKIVFDIPSDGIKSKRLAAPADGAGDRTYTQAQINSQNLNVIEDVWAVQITAEP